MLFQLCSTSPKKKTSSYYKSATSYGRVTTSSRSMSAIYESPFNVGFKFNYKMKNENVAFYSASTVVVSTERENEFEQERENESSGNTRENQTS